MAKRKSDPPPSSGSQDERDARTTAINWYVRKLLLHEIDMGMTQAEIARRSGMTGAQVNHIIKDARSAGRLAVIRLSQPVLRRSPGVLMDEALTYWEEKGRAEWAEHKMRVAREAARQVEDALRRRPSGERPSVKVRAGLVVPPPDVETKKK